MTPKKCMSIAKSLTDTQHMELEPLCTGIRKIHLKKIISNQLCEFFLLFIIIYFCTLRGSDSISLFYKKCYFIGLKSFKLIRVPKVDRLFHE
mgnify:FL=1